MSRYMPPLAKLANAKWIAGRNADGTADYNIIRLNGQDYAELGRPVIALQDRGGQLYNVLAYGALTADSAAAAATNTATIQAAIDAAEAAGGGFVLIPVAGTVWINDANADAACLNSDSDGVTIAGIGRGVTILKVANSSNAHALQFTANNWRVADLTIDGNRANQTAGHGIRCAGTGGRIDRVTIQDAHSYGIGVAQGDGQSVQGCVFTDVRTVNTGADGIDFKNKANANRTNYLYGITVDGFGLNATLTTQAGIDCRGPVHIVGAHVRTVDVDKVGIRFRHGETVDPNGLGGHFSSLSGFHIYGDGTGTTDNGVLVMARHVQVSNGYVENCRQGVVVQQQFAKLANVVVRLHTVEGFRLQEGAGFEADFGTYVNCGAYDGTGTGRAWRVTGDANTLIACNARNNSGPGVLLDAAADGTKLIACDLAGNSAAIQDSGSTNTVILNCAGATDVNVAFHDSGFRLRDNSDATKQLAIECSGITTATTRTLTVPNNDGTIAAVLSNSATLDFGSIAAQTCAALTITVTGAATGDDVSLAPPAALENGLTATGIVTAAATVTVRLCNITSGAIDPASASWRATVRKR